MTNLLNISKIECVAKRTRQDDMYVNALEYLLKDSFINLDSHICILDQALGQVTVQNSPETRKDFIKRAHHDLITIVSFQRPRLNHKISAHPLDLIVTIKLLVVSYNFNKEFVSE